MLHGESGRLNTAGSAVSTLQQAPRPTGPAVSVHSLTEKGRGDTVRRFHALSLRALPLGIVVLLLAAMPATANDVWPDTMPDSADEMEAFVNARYDVLDAELRSGIEVAEREGMLDVFALDEALGYTMSEESSDRTHARVTQWLRQAADNGEVDDETASRISRTADERKENHENIGERLVSSLMQKMADTGAGDNRQAQAWLSVFALFAVDFTEAMKNLGERDVNRVVQGIHGDVPPAVMAAATGSEDRQARETAFLEVMQASATASETVCTGAASRTVPGGREDSQHLRGMITEHCAIILAGVAVGDMPPVMLDLYRAAGWDETMGPVMADWHARVEIN